MADKGNAHEQHLQQAYPAPPTAPPNVPGPSSQPGGFTPYPDPNTQQYPPSAYPNPQPPVAPTESHQGYYPPGGIQGGYPQYPQGPYGQPQYQYEPPPSYPATATGYPQAYPYDAGKQQTGTGSHPNIPNYGSTSAPTQPAKQGPENPPASQLINPPPPPPHTQVVVVERERPSINHCLHCCISIFFWPWIFVWLFFCIVADS
eukprot:comp21790_c1_seq1/m.30965 comp21790_c1_seq1/g.30965  ORF comp21790_c1_seq1/g.30965 comp21790_c1_seq1/m.30965 type:complete len:203 (-) comp21790_c1_seq1:167-775(-)